MKNGHPSPQAASGGTHLDIAEEDTVTHGRLGQRAGCSQQQQQQQQQQRRTPLRHSKV
jgi:hypothetical protein